MKLKLLTNVFLVFLTLIGCENDDKKIEEIPGATDTTNSTSTTHPLTDTNNLASKFAEIDSTEMIKQVQNYLFHFGYLDIDGRERHDSLEVSPNLPKRKPQVS